MGSTVGVHTDDEVKKLSSKDKALLKQHVLHHIQTSGDIHRIIATDRDLMKSLTEHPKIKKILRTKARPMLKRLHSD